MIQSSEELAAFESLVTGSSRVGVGVAEMASWTERSSASASPASRRTQASERR